MARWWIGACVAVRGRERHTQEEEKEKEEERRREAFSFLFEAGDSVMANFSLQSQGFVTKDQQQSAAIRHSHSTAICATCLLLPPSDYHANASLRN